MLRPKWVVGRRGLATIVAPLALVLSMSISHQAMAACTASATLGTNFDCSDESSSTDVGSPPTIVTNNGPNATITGDNGNMVYSLAPGSSFTNSGEAYVTLGGTLNNTAGTQGYQRTRLYGVSGADAGDYEVTNTVTGVISVTHTGTGRMWGVAGNGDAESITLNNYGLVEVDRSNVTLGSVSATSLTAHGGSLADVSLDVGAASYSEEELEEHDVFNAGILRASGLLSGAIYSRAGASTIVNEGTIEATTTDAFAIAKVSDSGEIRTLSLDNSGTITGAILAVNGQAQRYFALSTGMGGTVDARLNINSQAGQVDSVINNSGTITGNLYFSNGTHVVTNTGTITGDFDVDQRITSFSTSCTVGNAECFATATTTGQYYLGSPASEEINENSAAQITTGAAVGSSTTYKLSIWGTKDFTFENAGIMDGNFTVITAAATTVGSYDVPDSSVTLKPHLFGSGSTNIADLDDGASGFINGTLKIWDKSVSTLSSTTTIDPVIDSLVRSGEWYTVAKQVYASSGDAPNVSDSVLVHWDVSTTAGTSGDSLAIGSTVNDAADVVPGLSNPGIATINALMQGGDSEVEALGGALQNFKDEGDVRKAGEQLAPETNFATQQAAFTLNMLTGSYIDNRLNGVGATATPSSAFAAPSGLGMSQTASAAPAGRMSLGLGMNDGRMNIGANDGRMDAGIYDKDPDLRGRGYSAALWGQAFGAGLDQSERQNVDGAQTHIYGGLAGADTWISSDTRLGFAAGYGNTSINGTGDTAQNKTDVDSYFGVIYGAYKGQGWYLSTRASYAWHDYSTTRVLNAGGLSDVATGSHSGNQYSASAEIGSPMHYYGATLTPVASLNWSQLDQDGYSETSGAGMALTIASQETTSLASGLGAKALIPIAADTLLEGRAIWYHEFEDTNQQVTAAFSGGSSFLASGPSVGRDTAAIGVGLFAYAEAGVSFQLNYDALLRQDFVGHTGTGRVKVEF